MDVRGYKVYHNYMIIESVKDFNNLDRVSDNVGVTFSLASQIGYLNTRTTYTT